MRRRGTEEGLCGAFLVWGKPMTLLACLMLVLTPGYVSRVIDGDTFILYSIGVPAEERVRLLNVDAAEIRDTLGPAAKAFTAGWIAAGPFKVESCKRDSFGRLLADVTRGVDTLAVDLIQAKLGVPR
jgi:endonuclease YncB( thermonuclease family)